MNSDLKLRVTKQFGPTNTRYNVKFNQRAGNFPSQRKIAECDVRNCRPEKASHRHPCGLRKQRREFLSDYEKRKEIQKIERKIWKFVNLKLKQHQNRVRDPAKKTVTVVKLNVKLKGTIGNLIGRKNFIAM